MLHFTNFPNKIDQKTGTLLEKIQNNVNSENNKDGSHKTVATVAVSSAVATRLLR